MNDPRVLRVVDANANRAVEGLRTAEDYARFVLDEPLLTAALKNLRHELAGAMRQIPEAERLAARDARGDVGPSVACDAENERGDAESVAGAAIGRSIEALRSLEEFGKLIDGEFAASIEKLRYRAYSLASAIVMLPVRKERLASARLYLLIDGGEGDEQLVATIRSLADAGVDCFQLRDKEIDDATLYRRAKAGAAAAREAGVLWVINDRADIAVAVGADGVHVGQDELPVDAVRKVLRRDQFVGISTHNPQQLEDAVLRGADYVGCGPVFQSGTKDFTALAGLEFLRHAARATQLPAFAIGGVRVENVDQVIAAGFHRVAVAGGVLRSENPAGAARQMKEMLTALSLFFTLVLLAFARTAVAEEGSVGSVHLQHPEIVESSGVAASHREAGLLWTHNDSGDEPRLFCFDSHGRHRAEVRIKRADAVDWEDMASYTRNGRARLLIADVGDNARRRPHVTLYEVDEPPANGAPVVEPGRRWQVQYEDGPRDCEAVAVDVAGNEILLAEKSYLPHCRLWSIPMDSHQAAGSQATVVAKAIGSLAVPLVTAMDISADGRWMVMATYADALLIARRCDAEGRLEPWSSALARPPIHVALPPRRQGESICFDNGGSVDALVLTSEKRPAPLLKVSLEGAMQKAGR